MKLVATLLALFVSPFFAHATADLRFTDSDTKPMAQLMRRYSPSGNRTTLGYLDGKKGEYEVFYGGATGGVFFQNSARTVYAKVKRKPNGYLTANGTFLRSEREVLAHIQQRYNRGDYEF